MAQAFPGVAWLGALALLLAVNCWLIAGLLVPYPSAGEPEFLLLLQRPAALLVWWIGSAAALAALRAARIDARALRPIVLLLLPPAAVALLATPLRRYAGPWLYLGIDLRWWLFALAAAAIAVEVGGTNRLRHVRVSRRSAELALLAAVAVCSLIASPPLRFQSVLVGDEPKYLRYLENWYRGSGADVSQLGPIADMTGGSSSYIRGNAARLARALAGTATDLAADTRRFVAGRPSAPDSATSLGGWFVQGRHGGIYQVHSPGISLLLFPGYVLDRSLATTHVWHPQFPSDLYFTNITVMILWVLWAAAVFRMLVSYTNRTAASALMTAVVFLSVPVTAFAYQYYPEVAAGLIVALLVQYGVLSTDTRSWRAAWHGVLAGFLPWLHVRFLPLTIAAAVAVVLTRRSRRTSLAGFGFGLALPLVALAVYAYGITGSAEPWALYALTTDAPLFSVSRAGRDLPAFWFDNTWGLIANAPVYLLAIPGIWLSWRRNRAIAMTVIAALLLTAVPAAGHGYTGAFTTPLRLVAAVVPLLAFFAADALAAFGSRPWFAAAAALLAVISVQNGLTYNIHLVKSEAFLQGATTSGWMFPLLLPDFSAQSRFGQPQTWIWIAVTIVLLAYPLVGALQQQHDDRPAPRWSLVTLAATTLVVFASAASLAEVLSGATFRPAFMLRPGDARDRLIHFALRHADTEQWSSLHGRIDIASYFPEPPDTTTTVVAQPDPSHAGSPVSVAIRIRRPDNRPGWGSAWIDFGDGSPRARVAIEESTEVPHTYGERGDYRVRVDFDVWGLPPRSVTQLVRVN